MSTIKTFTDAVIVVERNGARRCSHFFIFIDIHKRKGGRCRTEGLCVQILSCPSGQQVSPSVGVCSHTGSGMMAQSDRREA